MVVCWWESKRSKSVLRELTVTEAQRQAGRQAGKLT